MNNDFDWGPIHEAMQAVDDNEAYRQAMQRRPQVVMSESPPQQFFKFCKGNPQQAAERLALYWNFRLQVFGDTDAYLPLAQVMQPQELELVQQGLSAVMGPDEQGRLILFHDHSRAKLLDFEPHVRFRALFFFLHCVHKTCHSKNCTSIEMMVKWNNNMHMKHMERDKRNFWFFKHVIRNCMCFTPTRFHLVAVLPNQSHSKSFLSLLLPAIIQRVSQRFDAVPILAHSGTREDVIASLVQEEGFDAKYLPTTIGGRWTYETDFINWLQSHTPKPLSYYNAAHQKRASSKMLLSEELFDCDPLDADAMSTCSEELKNIPLEDWGDLLEGDFDLQETLQENRQRQQEVVLGMPELVKAADIGPTTKDDDLAGTWPLPVGKAGVQALKETWRSWANMRREDEEEEKVAFPDQHLSGHEGSVLEKLNPGLRNFILKIRDSAKKEKEKEAAGNRAAASSFASKWFHKDSLQLTTHRQVSASEKSTSSSSSASLAVEGDWLDTAMELLPADETVAYRLALERNPALIESESPPAQFLSFCQRKPLEAATRLAKYWMWRLRIYGTEAGLRPFSQLPQDVLEMAVQGIGVILPDADSQGRPVVCVDRARVLNDSSMIQQDPKRMREVFFLLHTVNRVCWERQIKEIVCILRWTRFAHGVGQGSKPKFPLDNVFKEALCFRPAQINIVASIEPGASVSRKFWSTLVPFIIRRVTSQHVEEESKSWFCPTVVHAGSQQEVLESLCEHGFITEKLPTTMGGNWCYQRDWPQWLQTRVAVPVPSQVNREQHDDPEADEDDPEADEEPGRLSYPDGSLIPLPPQRRAVKRGAPPAVSSGSSMVRKSKAKLGEEEALRRLRQQNVMYSRRKRARQKNRLQDLKESTTTLDSQNAKLKQEEARLKQLLSQARFLVAKSEQQARIKLVTETQAAVPITRMCSTGTQQQGGMTTPPPPPQMQNCLESLRRRQEMLSHEMTLVTAQSHLAAATAAPPRQQPYFPSLMETPPPATVGELSSGVARDDVSVIQGGASFATGGSSEIDSCSVMDASLQQPTQYEQQSIPNGTLQQPTDQSISSYMSSSGGCPYGQQQPNNFLQLLRQRMHELNG